jgi:flagellum-specific peptidoglycan hydrolase FlgJ
MKKLISITLAAVLLCFTAPAQAAIEQEINITTSPDEPTGLSVEVVEEILPEKLKDYAQEFCDGEEDYQVNMLFVMAIAKEETGSGTAGVGREHKHNLFGIKGSKGYRAFENYGESIENQFRMLKEVYFDNGRTTISSIAEWYCVPPDEWARKVSRSTEVYAEEAQETQAYHAGYFRRESEA